MTARALVADGLISFGGLCELVCVVGFLWYRNPFDQLHYVSAASTIGIFAFAAAVVVNGLPSLSGTVECVVALALTFALSPVVTAATGRAGRRAVFGSLEPRPEEFEQQPETGEQ